MKFQFYIPILIFMIQSISFAQKADLKKYSSGHFSIEIKGRSAGSGYEVDVFQNGSRLSRMNVKDLLSEADADRVAAMISTSLANSNDQKALSSEIINQSKLLNLDNVIIKSDDKLISKIEMSKNESALFKKQIDAVLKLESELRKKDLLTEVEICKLKNIEIKNKFNEVYNKTSNETAKVKSLLSPLSSLINDELKSSANQTNSSSGQR